MCFSPEASFIASGVLGVIGVSSLRRTKGKYKLIGAIPLIFAFQQFIEGFQWISVPHSPLSQLLSYGFVFTAFLIWPIYIPLAIFIIDEKTRNITKWFVATGVGTAILLLSVLVTKPLTVFIAGSISYNIDMPPNWFILAGYFIAVCGTPMVSSKLGFKILGLMGLISAVIAGLVFYYSFVSVWCFFVAAISGLIYLYARQDKPDYKLKPFDKAA